MKNNTKLGNDQWLKSKKRIKDKSLFKKMIIKYESKKEDNENQEKIR